MALALARRRGDVEARLLARAGEGDVAPLLQSLPADAEDEGALDGDALGGVPGEGVGVADVPVFEVAPPSSMRSPRSVTTVEGPVLAVDGFDRGAGAVLDAERRCRCGGRRSGRLLRTRAPATVRRSRPRRPWLSISARASALSSATSRRRRAIMTLPGRSSRAQPPTSRQAGGSSFSPARRRRRAALAFGEGEVVAAEAVADRFERVAARRGRAGGGSRRARWRRDARRCR